MRQLSMFDRAAGACSLDKDGAIARALAQDRTCARVLARQQRPSHGDLVGVRLNLNLFKSLGLAVQTVHRGSGSGNHRRGRGFYNNSVIWYETAVTLSDTFFNVNQRARELIARGDTSKFPMASADGIYMADATPELTGVPMRFNPKTLHLFVDPDNRPVRWAESVTVYGHRAYARGRIEYYTAVNAPARAGDAPSAVCFNTAL